MFRLFLTDLVAALPGQRRPSRCSRRPALSADPPLLREIRVALGKAVENGRAQGGVPHAGVPPCRPAEVPDFFAGCFGLGSRDVQAGDLVAAVENMLPGGKGQRHFYLGIDFVRPDTRLPKLEIWQQRLLESYPRLPDLALHARQDVNLLPEHSLAIRIHSVGGWGAITMGKNLALTAAELLGLHIKANPKYGSEKKGQPTTFYATLAPEPIRINAELRHVDVVLSPDPKVFGHSDPIAGLAEGGVFIIQCAQDAAALWDSLPATAHREIRERRIRVFVPRRLLIAAEGNPRRAPLPDAGAALWGLLPTAARRPERPDVSPFRHPEQLDKKFGGLGARVVEDNLRVIRQASLSAEVDYATLPDKRAEIGRLPIMLPALTPQMAAGLGNSGGSGSRSGSSQDRRGRIADPFAAIAPSRRRRAHPRHDRRG
jgi:pyruvate-ferredoxin/flavodoxin oxidoreductase